MEPRRLQLWQSHKQVQAGKIQAIDLNWDRSTDCRLQVATPMTPEGWIWLYVDNAYMDRHMPVVGGYFVRYTEGYESFSPAEPFEAGYVAIDGDERPTPQMLMAHALGSMTDEALTHVVVACRQVTGRCLGNHGFTEDSRAAFARLEQACDVIMNGGLR